MTHIEKITYRVEIREKYARKTLTFFVPGITIGNYHIPDVKENDTTYTIEGRVFEKKNIMSYMSILHQFLSIPENSTLQGVHTDIKINDKI